MKILADFEICISVPLKIFLATANVSAEKSYFFTFTKETLNGKLYFLYIT